MEERLKLVQTFATDLIKEYVPQFSFEFTNRKTQYGFCRHYKKVIGLSKHHALHSNDDEVLDTILHEIAHALVGANHGHDSVWKAKCREIGAKPNRCSSATILSAGHKYEFRCEPCNAIYPVYRKPKAGVRRCNACKTTVTFHVVK